MSILGNSTVRFVLIVINCRAWGLRIRHWDFLLLHLRLEPLKSYLETCKFNSPFLWSCLQSNSMLGKAKIVQPGSNYQLLYLCFLARHNLSTHLNNLLIFLKNLLLKSLNLTTQKHILFLQISRTIGRASLLNTFSKTLLNTYHTTV